LCVIVDASVAGRVFSVPYEADFVPLWDWLEKKDGKLVYGGRLAQELNRLPHARRRLAEMKRSGRALECLRQDVDAEERAVGKLRLCRSNDHHVVALARLSGARVLCTNDRNLEADFTNRQLVPAPKAKIYKVASHKTMLKHNRKCIGRPGARDKG
jgi:hypothetical protein